MDYLKVWTSFRQTISMLNDAEKGRLFDAMLLYAETGEEPAEFKGNERFLWIAAKQDIDRTAQKCESLRANASKGGIAKSKNQQSVANVSKDKQTLANCSKDKQTEANVSYKEKKSNIKKNNYIDEDDDEDDNYTGGGEEDQEESERRAAITAAIETQFGRVATPAEVSQIFLRVKMFGQSPEMAAMAIKIAAENGAKNVIKYVTKILDEWEFECVKTPDEAEELKAMRCAARMYVLDTPEEVNRMKEARERRKAEHERGVGA